MCYPVRRLLLSCLLAMVSQFSEPKLACASWKDDMFHSQACYDNARRHGSRDVMPCMSPIAGYTDPRASLLKCSIWSTAQGWDVFQFPWFVVESGTREWVTVLNGLSDQDLDRKTGLKIQVDCRNSGDPEATLMADYYALRAYLLEISAIDLDSMALGLANSRSAVEDAEVSAILDAIVSDCNAMKPDALVRNLSMCHEVLNLEKAPGESSYEKLVSSIYIGSN